MKYYDWNKIHESKSDIELENIFKGKGLLDFEARIAAAKKLLERGYDVVKIHLIKTEIIEKINNEILHIEKVKKPKLVKENTINTLISILTSVGVACFFFFYANRENDLEIGNLNANYYFVIVIIISLYPIFKLKKDNRKKFNELECLQEEKHRLLVKLNREINTMANKR